MATFYRMEKAVMAGLIGSGAVLKLSMANSVPNIPVGTLFEIIDKSSVERFDIELYSDFLSTSN